jgi:hypothetical protein
LGKRRQEKSRAEQRRQKNRAEKRKEETRMEGKRRDKKRRHSYIFLSGNEFCCLSTPQMLARRG